MESKEKIRKRLEHLLCNIHCSGPDRREGGCILRESERCKRIERFEMCMIRAIAEALIAEGVTFSENVAEET